MIEREARREAFAEILDAIDAWSTEHLSSEFVPGWRIARRVRFYVDLVRSRIINLYTAKR